MELVRRLHLADKELTWSPLNAAPAIPTNGGLLDWSAHPSRVCIYGAGHGHWDAPLDDEDWVVWALNLVPPMDSHGRVRADTWFDLHQRCAQTEDDLRWIAKCPLPIYVPDDLVGQSPRCIPFPLEQVLQTFDQECFSCTFGYQIALALLCDFTEIGLFGVELRYGSERERTVEWACTSFWIGYAAACGVKITVPKGSWLGRHPSLYGFDYKREIADVEHYLEQIRSFDKVGGIGG